MKLFKELFIYILVSRSLKKIYLEPQKTPSYIATTGAPTEDKCMIKS